MKRIYCRAFQIMMFAGAYFLPWREPEILHTAKDLAEMLMQKDIDSVLIVSDKTIVSMGLIDRLRNTLKKHGIRYSLYDGTVQNPSIGNVEDALKIYHANGCGAVIGFGGGSSIDCAKAVAARVAKPRKPVSRMKGLFKILKRTPTTVAVPTTAGSGSEATVASVIRDPDTGKKYAINDMSLIPHYAMLGPRHTLGLPPSVTATTGMDTLTHAVETYIGLSNTMLTKRYAEHATKLVFTNLEAAYIDGADIQARAKMQQASYLAGVAFTRAYVGNIHALSHAISGLYGTPHGLANAVLLPIVLEYYGKHVYHAIARLADMVGIGGADEEAKARGFITEIRAMNKRMGIPNTLAGLKKKDFHFMAENAEKEANPLYPVPVIFDRRDFIRILREVSQ